MISSTTLPRRAMHFSRLRTLSLMLLLMAALFGVTACATVNELAGIKDPKRLYDKGMSDYVNRDYEDAEKAFKMVMEEHPLSPFAVDAELMLGDTYYSMDKYDDALSYYTNFSSLHPTHPKAPYAVFQKGMSLFREVLMIDRDQATTKKALFVFQDIVSSSASTPYTARATELVAFLKRRLADREMYIARFYYKGKNYKGALARFRDVLKNYPDTGVTDETLYYIGESYANLGETALARDAYSSLMKNYPESPYALDARSRLN